MWDGSLIVHYKAEVVEIRLPCLALQQLLYLMAELHGPFEWEGLVVCLCSAQWE